MTSTTVTPGFTAELLAASEADQLDARHPEPYAPRQDRPEPLCPECGEVESCCMCETDDDDNDAAFVEAVAAAIGSTGDLGPDGQVRLDQYLAALGEPDDSFPFGPSARELRFAMASAD